MKTLKLTWICKDCHDFDEDTLSFVDLPSNEKQLKSELRMYRPFCCAVCGGDDFALFEYEEIEGRDS